MVIFSACPDFQIFWHIISLLRIILYRYHTVCKNIWIDIWIIWYDNQLPLTTGPIPYGPYEMPKTWNATKQNFRFSYIWLHFGHFYWLLRPSLSKKINFLCSNSQYFELVRDNHETFFADEYLNLHLGEAEKSEMDSSEIGAKHY